MMLPMSFASLGLSKELLRAIGYAGYHTPTPIQTQVIPLILQNRDVIAEAKTGTGKTAGFALPLLQKLQNSPLSSDKFIRALILTPTRELAMQVNSAIKIYGRYLTRPVRCAMLVGGMNIDVQMRALNHGADILVATPGRLLDVARRKSVDCGHLQCLVIDEADKMFNLGFAIELVLNLLPPQRQNLLFSATMDQKVSALANGYMPQAVIIKVTDAVPTVEKISQRAILVNRNNRGPLLRHLIDSEGWEQVLVFVASVRSADILMVKLNKSGIRAEVFHGGLTQTQRSDSLSNFKNNRIRVLVATDLASRGLDIQKLSYVVNYDLPRSSDDYIHRVGRTARAGQSGTAVSFIGHEDQAHFALIEKRARMRLERETIQGFELTGEPAAMTKGPAPVKGRRMSKKDKARAAAAQKVG
jgi:superfamily II DNA/RNA helicase